MDSDVPPLEVPPERAAGRAPWVGIILGAVLGVGAVVVVVPSGRQLPGILPGAGSLLKAAACLAAVFAAALAPLVHELGHVAGGWLAGYRFVWLVWGPVQVGREGAGCAFRGIGAWRWRAVWL